MAGRHSYFRVFRDPEVLEEMLNFRRQGYSYVELARRYNCDHTSIIHQCRLNGLALDTKTRDALFRLVEEGFSSEAIAERLSVSGTVVELYCSRYGVRGEKMFSRTKLHLEPIAPRPPKLPKEKAVTETQPKPLHYRVDERGVAWRLGENNEWICMGKSAKQERIDAMNEKKKALELKRIAMLTY